jgi:hypothetical protein
MSPIVGPSERLRAEAERLFPTVSAICSSPSVHQFRIGITATPKRRRYMYRVATKLRYPHFVILGPAMGKDDCVSLERLLQDLAKRTAFTYSKYDHAVRDRPHSPSVGGSALHDEYFIYMAWR